MRIATRAVGLLLAPGVLPPARGPDGTAGTGAAGAGTGPAGTGEVLPVAAERVRELPR